MEVALEVAPIVPPAKDCHICLDVIKEPRYTCPNPNKMDPHAACEDCLRKWAIRLKSLNKLDAEITCPFGGTCPHQITRLLPRPGAHRRAADFFSTRPVIPILVSGFLSSGINAAFGSTGTAGEAATIGAGTAAGVMAIGTTLLGFATMKAWVPPALAALAAGVSATLGSAAVAGVTRGDNFDGGVIGGMACTGGLACAAAGVAAAAARAGIRDSASIDFFKQWTAVTGIAAFSMLLINKGSAPFFGLVGLCTAVGTGVGFIVMRCPRR